MDASHIDVDRHLLLRCHLINLGGCAITYGRDFGCQLLSQPALALDDGDLCLRPPDGGTGETLIAGPLLGALRTVREVERLADAVESLPEDRPVLALLDGTLAFWYLQRGSTRHVADTLIKDRLSHALATCGALQEMSPSGGGRVHLHAPHHRGGRRRQLPFADYTVAVAVADTGHHPLRKTPATSFAALHTVLSRCLSGVTVGVGSHLGSWRRHRLCGSAGGSRRRGDLLLVGHRQLGRFSTIVEHLDQSFVLLLRYRKAPIILDRDPVDGVLAPVGVVFRFPLLRASCPLRAVALAVTAMRCWGSPRWLA